MLMRIFFAVFCLMFAVAGSSYAYKENIVAAWTFDADEGDTIIDVSGNANHGTLIGNSALVEGKFGEALEFDGGTTYIDVPFADSLNLLNESSFTIATWFVSYEIPGVNKLILQQLDANGTGRTWIYVTGDTGGEIASFLGGSRVSSGFIIEDGDWYHVAVVVTEKGATDSVQIYVNGKPEGDLIAVAMESCEGAFHIGCHKNPVGNAWNGVIDELVIFNKALSQSEINDLMTAGIMKAEAVEPESKLAVTWGNIKTDMEL